MNSTLTLRTLRGGGGQLKTTLYFLGSNPHRDRRGKSRVGHRRRDSCLQLRLSKRFGGVCAQVYTSSKGISPFWALLTDLESSWTLLSGLAALGGQAGAAQASACGRGGTGGKLASWWLSCLKGSFLTDHGSGLDYGRGRSRCAKLAEGRSGQVQEPPG